MYSTRKYGRDNRIAMVYHTTNIRQSGLFETTSHDHFTLFFTTITGRRNSLPFLVLRVASFTRTLATEITILTLAVKERQPFRLRGVALLC